MYPRAMKQVAVILARTQPVASVAELMGVPTKNIKRWIEKGLDRSKGGGRKPAEPAMEAQLIKLIMDRKVRNRKQAI
jgi:hypothetical protein